MKRLNIGDGSATTISDIVEYAREQYKDHDFCALRIIDEDGFVALELCEHQAINDRDVPSYVKTIGRRDEEPTVLEHFLRSVRKRFPHTPFAELFITSDLNWQRVDTRVHDHTSTLNHCK